MGLAVLDASAAGQVLVWVSEITIREGVWAVCFGK